MIQILICTYFAINLLVAVYFLQNSLKWEGLKYTLISSFTFILFGVLIGVFLFFLKFFAPILGWIYRELKFQYRFYLTDYWDKILLDDNYSEEYRTKEEKLKRGEELVRNGSKQVKRHNRQIQNKYAA